MSIYAPYNFVPLSKWVYFPDWANRVSQDVPFEDGYSGSIDYTMTAATPILVGGEHESGQEVKFFELPDKTLAIPGTSIKGMVRNVLEIASFGKLCRVDDNRYSVRDLTTPARPFYGDLMTDRVTLGREDFRAKPKAGWLSFTKGDWQITPCSYSRVEQFDDRPAAIDHLAALSGDNWWKAVPRVSAKQKYAQWGKRSLKIKFTPGAVSLHNHSRGKRLEYSKASALGTGVMDGTLVFTGQPAARPSAPAPGQQDRRPGKKHLEFIFHSPAATLIPIPNGVMRDFLHIHRRRDGYKGEEWAYWENRPQIPVFYLTDTTGAVTSLGLALMYKLAYDHTIHETIGYTHVNHLDTKRSDLAEIMIGRIGEKEDESSWKGRVSFSLARAKGRPAMEYGDDGKRTILNGPKPTYYPNYIVQKTNRDGTGLSGQTYATFRDGNALRGWKRYPVRPQANPQPLPQGRTGENNSVQVTLHPLKEGTEFTGKVRFHNLKPEELGALLWAMTLGNDDHLRHAIGMGKPFGFGQVKIGITQFKARTNDTSYLECSEGNGFLSMFTDMMEAQYKKTFGEQNTWRNSPQIRELLAMCDPKQASNAPGGKLEHMQLEKFVDGNRINEFVNAKQNEQAVLRSYTGGSTLEPASKDAGDHAGQGVRQRGSAAAKPAAPTIQTTCSTWDNARVAWDKGRQEMKAIGQKNTTAPVKGKDMASKLFSDQVVFEKLIRAGELRSQKVEVEVHGNMITLKKILVP